MWGQSPPPMKGGVGLGAIRGGLLGMFKNGVLRKLKTHFS